MTPGLPDMSTLIRIVEQAAGSDDPVARVSAAARVAADLDTAADTLLDHFVSSARSAGVSWAQIGAALGVTKQAAQQRFPELQLTRFTDRARRVLVLADEVAVAMNHNFLGCEHLLAGMVAEAEGIAGRILADRGIGPDQVRAGIVKVIGPAAKDRRNPRAERPWTPRAKKALEAAVTEAVGLGHNYVGTEHLLLAVLGFDNVARRVLADHGVERDWVAQRVTESLKGYGAGGASPPAGGGPTE